MLYVREDILSNLITVDVNPMESFNVELNLRNNKWLVNCSFNPHKSFIGNHLDAVSTEAAGQRCSEKKVLRNFAKFTGKHMCQSLFFNKLVEG